MPPYRVLPAQSKEEAMSTSEANLELKGNKQLLIDLGYPPNRSCATCGRQPSGKNSRFCSSGHDNHFLSALLANPASAPLIQEALN